MVRSDGRSGGRRRFPAPCALLALLGGLIAGLHAPPAEGSDFVTFESGQTRPLAISPDGRRLFALNTPDARLEIFELRRGEPVHVDSVPVGLEPVAVAARSSREVWVVNHVSDSVSVVDVVPGRSRVKRTLWVGDEPRDVVFAGPERSRAFVTTAHRGQNSPYPRADYAEPGVGRADVWVFDARAGWATGSGEPIAVLELFGDKPRALAVSPDGSRVYAAVFRSGNGTSVVAPPVVCRGGAQAPPCVIRDATYPGGLPAPNENAAGDPAPHTGLIVQHDPASGQWLDELGRDWSAAIRFELPDLDVFEIDADATPPRAVRAVPGVGTVLYGMAVNPESGVVYVSNTEAHNEVRFEGPGVLAGATKPPGEPASVRGRLHRARVSVVEDGVATPQALNPHIDYDRVPSPPQTRDGSLSLPMGMAVSGDGERLYLAAMGSDRVAVLRTEDLEAGRSAPEHRRHIEVRGGPTGVVLGDRGRRLYALARFENALVEVDLEAGEERRRIPLHDPEPSAVALGRRFLYDARLTSSNGEASCGVCHVFGDVDDLAWDLGNPDGAVEPNPNPAFPGIATPLPAFHPLKGPLLTQTLRGMQNQGPMHWRGDRTGGNATPPGDPLDERLAFEAFNGAFASLLGREGPLSGEEMAAFADFALALTPPPNPIRRLDNRLRADEERGRRVFFETSRFPGPAEQCQDCHTFDVAAGFFGSRGLSNGTGTKVPTLRAVYQRVGMFGFPAIGRILGLDPFLDRVDHAPQGPQVRGYGFSPNGSVDRVRSFLAQLTFLLDDAQVEDTEAFLMAAEAELAPIVGQQVTIARESPERAFQRLELLLQRAATPRPFRDVPGARECDLVARGRLGGAPRGWLWREEAFRSDRRWEPPWSLDALLASTRRWGGEITFTCVPPGAGERMGLDRDGDGALDGDELWARSDPADPTSVPGRARFGLRER